MQDILRTRVYNSVAVVAIGIVASIVVSGCSDVTATADRGRCVVRLESLYVEIEEYVNEHGELPRDGSESSLQAFIDTRAERALEHPVEAGSYIANPLLTITDLTGAEATIIACDSPRRLHASVVDDGRWDAHFLMTGGHVLQLRVTPDEYRKWCERFQAGNQEDEEELQGQLQIWQRDSQAIATRELGQ